MYSRSFGNNSACNMKYHKDEKNQMTSFTLGRGKKNHLSWSPGQVKFQSGQANIFIQCPTDK